MQIYHVRVQGGLRSDTDLARLEWTCDRLRFSLKILGTVLLPCFSPFYRSRILLGSRPSSPVFKASGVSAPLSVVAALSEHSWERRSFLLDCSD